MTEVRMPIPARAYNAAVGGHVCGPEDVDFGQKVVHLVKYDKDGNEVSFESQVTQANKIYVIHDDFTLSSNVTIPANCVLEFEGGSISNGQGNSYTITFDSNHSSVVIFRENYVCFKSVKLINLNANYSIVTATNFGLEEEDEITDVIGTGWVNMTLDLENIKIYQSINFGFGGCDFFCLKNANIYRKNNATFGIGNVKNLTVVNCIIDGSLCDQSYQGGTTFYDESCGIFITNSPNAKIENNIIQNIVGTGIKGENNNNIIIRGNTIHNCCIRNITGLSTGDTAGDGIYMRLSDNILYDGNIVSIDQGIQMGRCGLCFEYHSGGIIRNNKVSGYDRGIHIEHVTIPTTVENNYVKRCLQALLHWNNGDTYCTYKNNYLSNEGVNPEIPTDDSPLTYGRAVVAFRGSYTSSSVNNTINCKNTKFINNKVVMDNVGIEKTTNILYIEHSYAPCFIGNEFISNGENYGNAVWGSDSTSVDDSEFTFINNTIHCKNLNNLFAFTRYNIDSNNFYFQEFYHNYWGGVNIPSSYIKSFYRICKDNTFYFEGTPYSLNYTDHMFFNPSIVTGNTFRIIFFNPAHTLINKLYSDSVFDNNTFIRSQSDMNVLNQNNIVEDANSILYPIGKIRFIDEISNTMTEFEVKKTV